MVEHTKKRGSIGYANTAKVRFSFGARWLFAACHSVFTAAAVIHGAEAHPYSTTISLLIASDICSLTAWITKLNCPDCST